MLTGGGHPFNFHFELLFNEEKVWELDLVLLGDEMGAIWRAEINNIKKCFFHLLLHDKYLSSKIKEQIDRTVP